MFNKSTPMKYVGIMYYVCKKVEFVYNFSEVKTCIKHLH